MRIVRSILIICLTLGLIANGLSPAHATPCASVSDAVAVSMPDSAHGHAHHASHAPASEQHDGVAAASPDHAADHGDHHASAPVCNCGCLSPCGAIAAMPAPIDEAPARRAAAIRYAMAEQAAAGRVQVIDPGIPILAA